MYTLSKTPRKTRCMARHITTGDYKDAGLVLSHSTGLHGTLHLCKDVYCPYIIL
jgi:hypothetical protein